MKFQCVGQQVQCLCMVQNDYEILFAAFMSNTKGKLKAVEQGLAVGQDANLWGDRNAGEYIREIRICQNKARKVKSFIKPIYENKGMVYYGEVYNMTLQEKHTPYILSTKEDITDDLYSHLMNKYELPLRSEWKEFLFHYLYENRFLTILKDWRYPTVFSVEDFKIYRNGKWIPAKDLILYNLNLEEPGLEGIITSAVKSGAIKVSDMPTPDVEYKGLDDYMIANKKNLWSNITKQIDELVHVKTPEIYAKNVVFKTKRLFEKQQEKVMGAVRSLQSGVKYALLNQGMGVGKTIQSLAVVEEFFNERFLKNHPDKTLKDCYTPGNVTYRNIIICPAHLTQKWKEEIEKEVPGAHAEILENLSQLEKIRAAGPKRTRKEFYMIGKDFCKLDAYRSPVPYQMKKRKVFYPICKDCFDSTGSIYVKNRDGECPRCQGHNFLSRPTWTKAYGLICPDCGNILIEPSSKYNDGMDADDIKEKVLTPKRFASQNESNGFCFNCGSSLWQTRCKNLETPESILRKKPDKWYKITHFTNKAKKGKTTAWVLRGHEEEYLLEKELKKECMMDGGYDVTKENATRRVAPAHFIKKYLKGYFDFAILDEVHKFEGEGTAQANAALALVKASKWQLGLTGTIANGAATCLFSLLWLLEPERMVKKGWKRYEALRFAKEYGTVETVYEARTGWNSNKCSRGKQITQPRVKPGISPRLFLDFLIDRAVFMDITDMGAELPPLKESIEIVDMPQDVSSSYHSLIGTLKDCLRSKEGASAMSNILQMGLSYPDKPYERAPIMSARVENQVLAYPKNLEDYKTRLLPKEERLVKIIKSELAEGRNCFVYVSYTGAGDANVIDRLGEIVENNCNVKGRVCVVQSSTPQAKEREAYIKKKAAEGVKVFLINPKCCETGLDFCFDYKGQFYNYPTLIFYQISYELSVLWQASRRHYRANQTKECRTYWFAYAGTLQAAALQIMAEKQVAVSAIQGKFSSEGLASMAKGVNAQEKLAEALMEDNMSSTATLQGLFAKVNDANSYKEEEKSGFVFIKPLLYSELMGESIVEELSFEEFVSAAREEPEQETLGIVATEAPEEDLFALFDTLFENVTPKSKKAKGMVEGQTDLFSLFA